MLGSLTSALFAGGLCKYGKLRMIKCANLLLITGIVMSMFPFNDWYFAAARFIWGLAVGSFTVFVPKFITEVAPTEMSGLLGGANQVGVCAGILVPSLLALAIP